MEQNKPRVIRMAELCEQKGKLAIVGAELSNQHQRIQQLEKAESDLIKERDLRDEIIDRMVDAVLGEDRQEWSSNYDLEDAAQDIEDCVTGLRSRIHELETLLQKEVQHSADLTKQMVATAAQQEVEA